MDDSVLAKFPDHANVLGPFLGNLPAEILDAVVRKLGWFETTFALAGKSCREAVERVASTRAVLTEEERWPFRSREMTHLAVAAMEADVEALEWLIQRFDGKGLKWRDDGGKALSQLAARRGKIESLRCLHANRCPLGFAVCWFAAREGHLEVLQWARQNGCQWDARTCEMAAERGHLEVLQWALQNGCEWDAMTCTSAAMEGHLEVLRWARQNGCPWDARVVGRVAAQWGHLEVLRWARENGCE